MSRTTTLSRAPALERAGKAARRVGARATARLRVMPDYLIIGVKRGGTTSLQRYLTAHPLVVAPHAAKASHYFDVNHSKGPRWYQAHFPTRRWMEAQHRAGRPVVVGEASPYYCFHPLAIERIATELPEARLILVLRDPVERAWSHYAYERARGNEDLSFAEALDAEPARLEGAEERMRAEPGYEDRHWRLHSYLRRGHYAEQVERVWAALPREQLHVVVSEELFAQPAARLGEVFSFLGLPPHLAPSYAAENSNLHDDLEPALRRRLAEYYAPHNQRLYELLGRPLDWTSPG